jgi:undecaprenyl-diphosphatase
VTWLQALLLGALEGLTEFLPVSSTGHLVLFGASLGHEDEAAKTLSIVIQLGAVLAVIVHYWSLLVELGRGVLARDPAKLRLALALGIAFLPAAVVGLAFHRSIKEHLFGSRPVAYALIVGGVLMVAVELARRGKPTHDGSTLEDVTPGRAFIIGIAQCFSLWPGMSRSMTTIVGGQLSGLGTATAAEFSFLLSIPVLGAATVYDLYKGGGALIASEGGSLALGLGLISAFVVSMLAIGGFLRYLKRFGLLPFGLYRIALGIVVLLLVGTHAAG